MAEGLNRVMLLGNLGADPELRFTQGGQAVLNMRLATTESYLDKNKVRQERTDWHNVVVWGKRGEGLAKILNKGSRIFVEGRLSTTSYDDRDGNKRYKTEVVANNVLLAGGRGRDAGADDAPGAPAYEGDYGSGGGGSARGGGGGYGGGRPAAPGGGAPRGRPAPAAGPAGEQAPPADDYPADYGGGSGGGGGEDDIPF